MATGRSRSFALGIALASLVPLGCAQPGPFTSRQTMAGSLKASVSQLQFENEKLRKDVAELKADNSRLDTLLTQESQANGEMSARLDDARDLIRRQGGSAQAMNSSSKNFEDDPIPPPVATPRSRSTKGGRKPPSVTLPQIDTTPFGSSRDDFGSRSDSRTPRDLGPLEREDEDRWLPVARGLGSQVR